ncbi:MAG: hypothetical protein IPN16_13030 [Gemmatimonadetes bacterium]|nr:hypothetical protein [Gemmatimonadota bacterium]
MKFDLSTTQLLTADWLRVLGNEADFAYHNHSANGATLVLQGRGDFEVVCSRLAATPYLALASNDPTRTHLVESQLLEAVRRAQEGRLGGYWWYTSLLTERPLQLPGPNIFLDLVQRLGSQRRITGWRRLSHNVLLEFEEAAHVDATASIVAPGARVRVHIGAPGPCLGFVTDVIAHSMLETISAICGFALGRPLLLPPMVFPAEPERVAWLRENQGKAEVPWLTRDGVGLGFLDIPKLDGGFQVLQRLRNALLTFDAALVQDREAVACILYVAAAEALTVPEPSWRREKLTMRFCRFFEHFIPKQLNELVRHPNFEEAFGVRRGTKEESKLRRKALETFYALRSGQLHEGLNPNYRNMVTTPRGVAGMRAALLRDFAEAAILGFLQSPRSSLIGHPMWTVEEIEEKSAGSG